jgi:CRISPR-associated protein Csh2
MKKIYILSGLKINKAQWNADFSGLARRDSDGNIFATDKARKYSIRQELLLNNENILIRKRYDDNAKTMSLQNILKDVTGSKITEKNIKEEIEKLFLTHIDLRIFGFIINPSPGININAHGSFQIYFANDIYKEETEDIIMNITSFKTSGTENGDATLGSQAVIDKGYLNYTICIQPEIYKNQFKKIVDFNKPEFQDENGDIDQNKVDTFIEEKFEDDLNKFLDVINTDVTNTISCTKNSVNNIYNVIVVMQDTTSSLDVLALEQISIDANENLDLSNVKKIYDNSNSIESIKVLKSDILKVSDFETEELVKD